MKNKSAVKEILCELEFDEKWVDLGFVSLEKLKEFWASFQNGEDKNKEHFRWTAFNYWLKNRKNINENNLRELYRLGETNADCYGMGMSTRIEILNRKDCPADLINEALNSEEKSLVKIAKRKIGL